MLGAAKNPNRTPIHIQRDALLLGIGTGRGLIQLCVGVHEIIHDAG